MDSFFYVDETLTWGFTFNFAILLALFFIRRWREFIKPWRLASYFMAVVFCAMVLIEFGKIFIEHPGAMRNTDGYTVHFALFNFLALVLFMPARIRNSFLWGFLFVPILHYQTIYAWVDFFDSDKLFVNIGGQPRSFFSIVTGYVFNFIVFNVATAVIFAIRRFWLNKRRTRGEAEM